MSPTSTLEKLGHLFYMVSPNATTFQYVDQVPEYHIQVAPLILTFLLLEWLLESFKEEGKKNVRNNDYITSIMTGVVFNILGVTVAGYILYGYDWLYQYRLFDLDWSSPVTWWVAMLGVDCGYYWFHRAQHEVNLLWVSHKVHHSSEDYNISDAIRLSMFQRIFSLGVYHPLAVIGVPPAVLLVHLQFNQLFMFWLHTGMAGKLGPLEWILNTPSHHRVHHGSNKYCLDKNYGSVLIIWDRMFGTFQAEREDEPIVYGLVTQPQSLNMMWLQLAFLGEVFVKALSMTTWGDTFRALFYGPGWNPGTPRLGDPDTFPDVKAPRAKYDPQLPRWQDVYILIHFVVIILIQQRWIPVLSVFLWVSIAVFAAFIGLLYDGWWWASLLEAARCLTFVGYAYSYPVLNHPLLDPAVLACFAFSSVLWTSHSIAVVKAKLKHHKRD